MSIFKRVLYNQKTNKCNSVLRGCYLSLRSFCNLSNKISSCSFTLNSSAYCIGYNDDIYQTMKDDKNRTSFYRNSIQKHCKDKVVLDIGCGSLCLLAVMAAECGAAKVFAIETNQVAFNNAKQLIKEKDLSNKIEIFNGYSMDDNIELTQKCDIVIHEIIGEIGSCEGVYAALKDAKKRFVNHSNSNNKLWSIPNYVQTYLTPVEFPDIKYWQSLKEKIIVNDEFYSINLWNFPERHYLSLNDNCVHWGLWENIHFNKWDDMDNTDQFIMDNYSFIAQKDGVLGGLLSSIMIGVDDEFVLSSKTDENNCMWANKLIVLNNKIDVKAGDTIHVTAETNALDPVLKYDFNVLVES